MNSLLLTFLFLCGGAMAGTKLPDFDKFWDYADPAGTEARFRELLPQAENSGNLEYLLQLETQIARTHSIRLNFSEAHRLLDKVESRLAPAAPIAEIRYLLERGRTFDSAKEKAMALPFFEKAFHLSTERNQDFHGVDAAHMVAISAPGFDMQLEWNLKAVALAEKSSDPRARGWLPFLYNNIGFAYLSAGHFQEALEIFQKNQAHWEGMNNPYELRIAKWCVGRALRSLSRLEEALSIQKALEVEFTAIQQPSGYVFEELAEIYLLLGQEKEAGTYFRLAFGILSKDSWFAANEPERFQRMKEMGEKLK